MKAKIGAVKMKLMSEIENYFRCLEKEINNSEIL
jgi:hypothetical protein